MRIMLEGSPILRVKCPEMSIKDIETHLFVSKGAGYNYGLAAFLADMNKTMVADKGMGLAANQVGYPLRIFVLKDDKSANGYTEYINPEILTQEDLTTFEGEGCLSIPGVNAATQRFRKLTLRWLDKQGTTHEDVFEDTRAFAVQHEIDHLDGKLYIDQFGPVKRSMILKKHKKYIRAHRR